MSHGREAENHRFGRPTLSMNRFMDSPWTLTAVSAAAAGSTPLGKLVRRARGASNPGPTGMSVGADD